MLSSRMHEVSILFIGVILTNRGKILLLYSFLPREECTTTCYDMNSTDIFTVDLTSKNRASYI